MLSILYLVPMSVLGVLLLFAGTQLSLTVIDMKAQKDLFVSLMILGLTLASNLNDRKLEEYKMCFRQI